jgi:putative spermidine/putrescine transport system substrate-binding protein
MIDADRLKWIRTPKRLVFGILPLLLIAMLVVVACGEAATATPEPDTTTEEPQPTAAPEPTAVPQPTATAVPGQVVTATEEPTEAEPEPTTVPEPTAPAPEPESTLRPRDEWTVENPATLAEVEAELEKHRGKSIVVLGPGGAFTAAVRQAYFMPFTEQFGIEVIEDTPTPNTAKWVAAAETGNIDWDVSTLGVADATSLRETDSLEELDLSVIDNRDLLDPIKNLSPYMGGGDVTWSIVMAYNTDVYPGDSGPKSWADFYDLEKFPGRRALRHAVAWGGHIQFTRLAREPDLLNSPEGKQAANTPSREQMEEDFQWFADWADEAASDIIYWASGSQCPELLISREVEMCSAYNGRIFDAAKEGAPIRVCWECGHIINLSGYALPNGMKELYPERYELANLYMAWINFPEINAQLSKYISYGPVNRKAIPLLDSPEFDEVRDHLPTSGANAPYGIVLDEVYLGENLAWAEEQYILATQ